MSNLEFRTQLNQKQELRMTPEMIQTLRILQMNYMELSEYISEALLENPVLDEIEPERCESRMSEDELFNQIDVAEQDRRDAYDRFDFYPEPSKDGVMDYEKYVRQEETLKDHLMDQLRGSRLSSTSYDACEYLINSVDEDGYLCIDIEEVEKETSANGQDVQLALDTLQSMDPAGVGAKNLSECLKLQLIARDLLTPKMERLIDEMLEDIAQNHIQVIAKTLQISRKQAQEMVDLVRKLEPKPGRRYSDGKAVPFVIPDVIVQRIGGVLNVSLNEGDFPKLCINSYYRELISQAGEDKELRNYLSEHFRNAEHLIGSIEQRDNTIMRVTNAIIMHQQQFFEPGNKFLQPLTMQQIADELGIHLSTVSRAIDGKYMQCGNSTFSLRHFFGSGIKLDQGSTDSPSGDASEVSAITVRHRIRDIVGEEDSRHPLSDQKIADSLNASGVQISRRTVAKYRELEGIPAASQRRRYE